MRELPNLIAVGFFLIALIIILFGSGLKVIYSSGFFIILGLVLIINAKVKRKAHQNN
jgi:hypothetical protein